MAPFWKLCYVIGVIVTQWIVAEAQSAEYPLVNVNDTAATIAANTMKKYTTTVRLTRNFNTVQFTVSAFTASIAQFYETNLPGYIQASSVTFTTSGEKVDVRYDVEARYSILNSSSDAVITNGIANYNNIVGGLLSGNFRTFYVVLQEDADAFSFAGQSLCGSPGVVTCTTPNTACSESVDGVTVNCVSPCKNGFCKNNGTCAQPSTQNPPTCTCISQSDIWYLGAQCETFVALWMVIIAAVGAFLLLVGAIIIACCCYSAKRRKKEKEAQFFHDPKDVPTFTNNAYIHNEPDPIKIQPREAVFQERNIDAAALAAARRRSRSSSRDRRRRHRSRTPDSRRRHRSRTPESRRRRHSDRRHRRSRRSERPPTSNSAVSSFESSSDSFESSDEETAPPAESRRSSTSSDDVTDSASSSEGGDVAVVAKSQGTSPIRWKTPSEASTLPRRDFDIAARKGWMPSLGPQMFDLPRAESGDLDDSLPEGSRPSPYVADTDI